MVTPTEEYREVAGAFTERVRGVADWDVSAPVAGWTARDVVRHLVEWFPSFLESGAGITLQLQYSDPECQTTVVLGEDFQVIEGDTDLVPDVTLMLSADDANKYWRGDLNLAVSLARGKAKSKGPVNKILKLVPLTKPLFPIYKEMTAAKDAA